MPCRVAVLGSGVDAVARSLPPPTSPESSSSTIRRSRTTQRMATSRHCSSWSLRSSRRTFSCRTPTRRATSRRRSPPGSTVPLITDVIGSKTQGSDLVYVRPAFQGKLSADVVATGPAPHLATFQIGAYRADAARKGASPGRRSGRRGRRSMPRAIRQKPEAPFKEARQAVDLSQAERIVAAGRGIKAQEHLKLVEQLAQALGAEVAASRPICDAGWLPMDRQIGSSGQTVAPKLYLALGISGAIQHLVGMKGSRTIVAINKDADAPIFESGRLRHRRRSVRGRAGADRRAEQMRSACGPSEARSRRASASGGGAPRAMRMFPPTYREPRDPRRRHPDRRRWPVRHVGRAAAGAAAEAPLAASRLSLPFSRRREKPARTCCRGPSWIRRRFATWCPTTRNAGRRSPRRCTHDHVYFLTRGAKLAFPFIPPPLRNHGNSHHLPQPFREVARRTRRSGGDRRLHGVSGSRGALRQGSGRGCAHRRSRHRTARRSQIELRAWCRHPGEGHDPRRMACAATSRRRWFGAWRSMKDVRRNSHALGIKELWELPKDRLAAWHGHPYDGLSAANGGVRRRLHLCHARRTGFASDS